MPNPTVRISSQAYETLKSLSEELGETMQAILDRAIEAERRRRFFEDANSSYQRVREDPEAWAEVVRERADWDVTLLDGLEDGGGY